MFCKIVLSAFVISFVFMTTSANAFKTQADTAQCRVELKEFQHQVSIVGRLLRDADNSTHPKSGFLNHLDVFDKRTYLLSYAANGSDAFYALSPYATASDCAKLEEKLSTGITWIAEYVVNKDPNRCSKYKQCD